MPDAVRQLGSRAQTGTVLLAATLLTIGIAAPVLVAPGRRLFGAEIVGRHADPFVVIAALDRPSPPGVYTQPLFDYPGAALVRVVGPVAAYNLLVLSSFPLAALFAYLLARDLTRSTAAAVFAGMTYAFLPVHLAHAAYHPHVSQIQWLPLYLLALWRLLARPGAWLVAFELAPSPWRSRDVLPTPAHRWIANQPPPVHLLDMTVTRAGIDPAFERLLGHEVSFRSPAVTDLDEPNIAGKPGLCGELNSCARRPFNNRPAAPCMSVKQFPRVNAIG